MTGVRGQETNLETVSDVRRRGGLGREFVITYRNHLEPNETLEGGTFWTGQPPQPADATELEVTVEQGIHERSRIHVGDLMRFDVLGRSVDARVIGIREVEWEDARNGGFMFVFRPGPLERAPHTYIGTLQAPAEPAAPRRLPARPRRQLIPNVSAIDVREVLASIQGVIDNVTLAISIVGAVALGERRADPDRRGRDDEVPACLRGRDPAHARRQHAAARDDAGARVQRARPAGGVHRRGRRARR